MKKILDINNLSLLTVGVVLTLIAVFNSFMYVGLVEDGAYRFFEGLTKKDFLLGVGGFPVFPFNLRYFSSIWSHSSVGFFANLLEMHNIKYLLYIFTFVSYFKFLIILAVIYLNLPRNKKQFFEMILLSFLLTFAFTSYQVWAENIMTGLFIWVLFVIFYYVDFDKLTVFNKFCIVIFSFMLISSHQMVLIFIPFLLIIALKKDITAQNLKISSVLALRMSYLFLFAAIIFNLFSLFDLYFGAPPISVGQKQKYIDISPLLGNTAFVLTCVFIMIILLLSFFKNNYKYDNLKYLITGILLYCILKLLLFEIPTDNKFANITLGFHIPLFFFILIICLGFLNIKPEYKYIKFINLTFCLLIWLNSLHYGLLWKLYLTEINQYIADNKTITLFYSEKKIKVYPILARYGQDELETVYPGTYFTTHSKYMLYILIFMKKLFDEHKLKDYVVIKKSADYICNDTKHSTTYLVIKRKEMLKKFGIDIDSFITVNNNSRLDAKS